MAQEYFDDTAWMESAYAGEYRQNADHFVLGRRMQLFIMQSFYRHFLADRQPFDCSIWAAVTANWPPISPTWRPMRG